MPHTLEHDFISQVILTMSFSGRVPGLVDSDGHMLPPEAQTECFVLFHTLGKALWTSSAFLMGIWPRVALVTKHPCSQQRD
jgi:hypothetical protein